MKITYYKKICQTQCDGYDEIFLRDLALQVTDEVEVIVHRGIDKSVEDGIPELPALLINGKIAIMGWKPTEKEIIKAVKKNS